MVLMPERINKYTDSGLSPRTTAYAMKKLLSRGQDMLVTERFGQVDPMQKNKTKSVTWRRYKSLQPAVTALTEGVTPEGSTIMVEDINATMQQYGDWVQITDHIADFHEDPVLNEMMEVCGEQAAETIELIRIAFMTAGSNVYYANGVASRSAVNSAPTRGDFRKIYRQFKRNKAKEFTRVIKASPDTATEPVNAAYFALGHTDLDADVRGITGFVPSEKYADQSKAFPGEVGKVENTRVILTNLFNPWVASGASGTTFLSNGIEVGSSAAADVYPLVFIARDSYGIVPMSGKNSVKPMFKNPGSGSPTDSDPLNQRGFVSWKCYQTGAILNDAWLARLECAATANPS